MKFLLIWKEKNSLLKYKEAKNLKELKSILAKASPFENIVAFKIKNENIKEFDLMSLDTQTIINIYGYKN